MKLIEAVPSIFERPLPVVGRSSSVVVAGTLLDYPRRDILTIAPEDGGSQPTTRSGKCFVFGGYSALLRLFETEPEDHYRLLINPSRRASLLVRPLASDTELADVLDEFYRTKFGWALVEEGGRYGVVALPDLIPLYRRGVLRTDLSIRDVATPKVFRLSPGTSLRVVLRKMLERRMRRVFFPGSSSQFVSDREILTFMFRPERLTLARDNPHAILDATLEDVGDAKAVSVDGDSSVKDISRTFTSDSGAWCVLCDGGLVTPWDMILKPWKMGRLTIGDKSSAGSRRSRGSAR